MPWECCGETRFDDVSTCPACGTSKRAWTIQVDATRVFTLGKRKQGWVELSLRDAAGAPMAGERYVVTTSARKKREGYLDDDGFARVAKVTPGRCSVSFPDLDGAEWDWEVPPAGASPASAPAPAMAPAGAGDEEQEQERAWIELRVQDEAGEPLAGARYQLTAADGSTREGALDSQGEARVDDLPPGSCKLAFPDLDAAEWQLAGQDA